MARSQDTKLVIETIPVSAIAKRVDIDASNVLLQVFITPDLALDWLTSRNTVNRRLRRTAVARYVSDIKSNRWHLDVVEPIRFSRDGRLLDGQHRLTAIVESEQSLMQWVQVGLPIESQISMDAGLPRRQLDFEAIHFGQEINSAFVAVARSMAVGATLNTNHSRSEMHEFIATHFEAIKYAQSLFPSHIKGVTTAAVKAAIARAYYTRPRAKLDEFADTLRTGLAREPYQESAVVLRNWMQTTRSGGGQVMKEWYLKTERVIQAFCDEQRLSKIYASDRELFPLPEEQAA